MTEPSHLVRRLALLAAFTMALAPPAAAQESSHWGLTGSFAPTWTMPPQLGELLDYDFSVRGSDLQVGIARGRDGGGNWGITYLRKAVRPGSVIEDFAREVCLLDQCAVQGLYYRTRNIVLNGVEIDKFFVFGTIRRRVQIGMVLGAGVGRLSGDVERHRLVAAIDADPATGYVRGYRQDERTSVVPAGAFFDTKTWPLARVEVAVSVLVARGLKARVSGGVGTLSTHTVNVTLTYFPGGR